MLLIQWEGLSLSGHTADTISHVTVRSYCWYNEKSCHCQVILLIQWEVLTLSGNNANKKKGLALSSHTNLYCICQWTGVLHHPQPPPQSSRFNLPARLTQGSRHPKSAFPHRRCRSPGSTRSWWQTLDPPSLRPCQQQTHYQNWTLSHHEFLFYITMALPTAPHYEKSDYSQTTHIQVHNWKKTEHVIYLP